MKISFAIGLVGAMLIGSSTARAAEVSCETDLGTCTVSNDNGQFSICACADDGGEEVGTDDGPGPGPWDDLSEAELMEICLDRLEYCHDVGGGSATTGGDPTCGGSSSAGTTDGEDTSTGGSGPSDTGTSGGSSDDTGTSGGSPDDTGDGGTSGYDEGEGGSSPADEGDDGDDGEGSSASGGFDPSLLGCSAGGRDGGALAILGLGLLGFVRRRRG